MGKKVPYLKEEQIERDAAALLAQCEEARGVKIGPAAPIEDIVEKHLKLKLGVEFDDMHRLLNHPRSGQGLDSDILGAIFFDERRIVIDESLDPEEHPSKEGRYRFTLAHEGGGHWRLHRNLFVQASSQVSFFNEPHQPSVVCRSSHAEAGLLAVQDGQSRPPLLGRPTHPTSRRFLVRLKGAVSSSRPETPKSSACRRGQGWPKATARSCAARSVLDGGERGATLDQDRAGPGVEANHA